jgi:hypothetical protein
VPVSSMNGVMDKSWKVDDQTMKELMTIHKEAGIWESIKNTLKDVVDMINETAKEKGLQKDG